MTAKAQAYLAHHIHGRTRFRIPDRRGDPTFLAEVARRLTRLSGVKDVNANPQTGSILVHHSVTLDTLLEGTLGTDVAEIAQFALNSPSLARRVRADVDAIDQAIRRYTGGEFDLNAVVSLALVAMAVLQLVRGRHTTVVPAVSLAWYATELMRRASEPPPHATEPSHR